MQKFDCLIQECPLFGKHLLEASAGTGKTFTIEHVFVRLILEGIPLEKILVVTFTRAATRELKLRICENLKRALNQDSPLPYLKQSERERFLLQNSLKNFAQAQIFTIHGFCFRTLQEHAFETGNLLSTDEPDHPFEVSKKLHFCLEKFFQTGIEDLCPEQISLLFSKFETIKEIGKALLRAKEIAEKPLSFEKSSQAFFSCLEKWGELDLEKLTQDFEALKINYLAKPGDFLTQIQLLSKKDFSKLLLHRGSLFSFLSVDNQKVRTKEVKNLHYLGIFDEIGPIIFDASNQKKIIQTLQYQWQKWEEKDDVINSMPDEILKQMHKATNLLDFSKKFDALIIDEFQDTDPLQWDIFYKAFISKNYLLALYLVGDPKQSIYRFRNADVYTYYKAKDVLGEENTYVLDTNFRSSKELIESLNALFSRNWLKLPKKQTSIEYVPVKAGLELKPIQDEKKALHFLFGEKETNFLPYVVQEIEQLDSQSIAILVKDRFEAKHAQEALVSRGIACIARSHETLGSTPDFRFFREFMDAVCYPSDENFKTIAENGPFSRDKSFIFWKTYIEERGLSAFFSAVFKGEDLSTDLRQILEEVFAWEQREGFSFDGLVRFLDELETSDAEDGFRRRVEGEKDAVEILTMHVSKGLEFDVVFALGLATPAPENEEEKQEYDAEKLRQLYVAMTRAKRRLYVPYRQTRSEKRASPMDLFVKDLDESFPTYLEKLSSKVSISYETIPSSLCLSPVAKIQEPLLIEEPSPVFYKQSYLQSFSSLTKEKDILLIDSTEDELPRGKETGTIIHNVFEMIFSSKEEIWKQEKALDDLVAKILSTTVLADATSLVQTIVQKTLTQALFDGKEMFCLKELRKEAVAAEMEFCFSNKPHYMSGLIDLIFFRKGKVYFIDWKTNVLRSPTPSGVKEVMQAYEYDLQASLYAQALRLHFDEPFGGAFYIFVRTGSYIHFMPKNF